MKRRVYATRHEPMLSPLAKANRQGPREWCSARAYTLCIQPVTELKEGRTGGEEGGGCGAKWQVGKHGRCRSSSTVIAAGDNTLTPASYHCGFIHALVLFCSCLDGAQGGQERGGGEDIMAIWR